MRKNNARSSYECGLSQLIMDCRVKPGAAARLTPSFGRLCPIMKGRLGENREAQASPDVSNMAASSAARAGLPAQTTNWNAGK